MKIFASGLLIACLLAAASCFAADKADPADYPLTVHVSGAAYGPPNELFLTLTATIKGMHYQLVGPTSSGKLYSHANGLINPGDYRARLTVDEHKSSYESMQQYEILFPDGTTRKFSVVAQSE